MRLDANIGCWQVEISNRDEDETAFTAHHGLHQFIWFRFGLKNVLGEFQRAMNVFLAQVKWQTALPYVKDKVMCSKTLKEHATHAK